VGNWDDAAKLLVRMNGPNGGWSCPKKDKGGFCVLDVLIYTIQVVEEVIQPLIHYHKVCGNPPPGQEVVPTVLRTNRCPLGLFLLAHNLRASSQLSTSVLQRVYLYPISLLHYTSLSPTVACPLSTIGSLPRLIITYSPLVCPSFA
jgi:hypothetical protein